MKVTAIRPPRLRTTETEEERKVTWTELFYDLVFVVAVSGLGARLLADPTLRGAAVFTGLFVPLWWAWAGFTLYADRYDTDDLGQRILAVAQMATIALLAASISGKETQSLVGFALAYLMHKPFRGQALYYILFILPMLTVPIVIAYTAEMLLYESGPVNDVITRVSGEQFKVAWLSNPQIALLTVMLLEIWNWTPFSFIIMLAGFASIPKEPIEAARILGASSWRIFWEVQLPLLRPVIFLALTLRFLEAMAEFPKIWALFQGGPGSATETITVYIYLTTWQYFQVSKGAALSYVAMILMILIVLAVIRLLRREKQALDAMHVAPQGDR